MKVITISGRAGCGKDTVAKIMKEELINKGCKSLVIHYADLLKFICREYFEWDGNKGEKGRHLLQYIGTDVVRNYSPDFWVNFVIEMLKIFRDQWEYVLIPDIRFPNEISRLKEEGFYTIHVNVIRPDYESALTTEQQHHQSETALDNITPDYTINNDETLKSLSEKIKIFVEKFLKE